MNMQMPSESRYEIKYACDEILVSQIRQWFRLHAACFTTPYPPRWVNNIYFDTHNYSSFAQNLSGASARQKVRYRWYGAKEDINNGVLEVKCKRNYFGWKKNVPIVNSAINSAMTLSNMRHEIEKNLPDDLKQTFQFYQNPIIINRYFREYLVSRDKKVRVTIDFKQVVYDQRYSSSINLNRNANITHNAVVEFKFNREDQLLGQEYMQNFPIRVSRNSKYISAVRAIQNY